MTTGKRIKTLRERLHIPQTELAESIHISKQTLYKYENFYEYTKDRIDSEFKYLLGKAQKLSTNKLQDFPSTVQEPSADYLTADAAHERTDTDFTDEDRKADEDMLD